MSAGITGRRMILTGLAAVMLGTAALACAPPPDRTPPTITSFTISPRVAGFWSDGVLYYWIRGVATVSVTADAGAGDTVTAINCTSTAGVVTGGAYNPTTPAQVRSRTFTLDVTGLSHGADFWVKVTATDSHSNTTNPEDHKLRNRVHAIDLQGQPQVTIGLAVEYPARSGAEVQPGADVCNAVQPRFRINIPWPRIDPSKDAVEFAMQEAPNPPYQPEQPWHPGQREQSQHGLGDYEQVFTTQGKTLQYIWDTQSLIWPQYHFTQYKHNGLWNERGTFKYHWWWEPTYQGNPITSRGISTEAAPNPAPGPWTVVSPLPVTVRNVTIASATASGGVGASGAYWLFDPTPYTPQNPPQLTVTYDTDKLRSEFATTTLKVYGSARTDDTPLATLTATSSTDASSQQITWNGMENGQLVEKGIYVFDLSVEAAGSPYEPESGLGDGDGHKSASLHITSTDCAWTDFNAESGMATVRTDYSLSEAGTSAGVQAYDPDFQPRGNASGTANAGPNSASLGVVWDKAGPFRFLVSGQEDPVKDHRHSGRSSPREALQKNAAKDVSMEVTFSPAGFLPMPSWANGTDGAPQVSLTATVVGGTGEDRSKLNGQNVTFHIASSGFPGYCTASEWPFPQGIPTGQDYSFAADQIIDQQPVALTGDAATATLYPLDCGGVVGVTTMLGQLKVHYKDPNVNPNDPQEIKDPLALWIPSPRKGFVPAQPERYLPRAWWDRFPSVPWPDPGPDLEYDDEPKDPDGPGGHPAHAKAGDRRTAWEEYRGYPTGAAGLGQITRLSPEAKEVLFELDVMASPDDPQAPIRPIADIQAQLQRARDIFLTGFVTVYWKFDETTAPYVAPEGFPWEDDLKAYAKRHKNAALPKYGYILYDGGHDLQDDSGDIAPMRNRAFCSAWGIVIRESLCEITAHEIGHPLNIPDAYEQRPQGWQDMLMGGAPYTAIALDDWEIARIAITGMYFK